MKFSLFILFFLSVNLIFAQKIYRSNGFNQAEEIVLKKDSTFAKYSLGCACMDELDGARCGISVIKGIYKIKGEKLKLKPKTIEYYTGDTDTEMDSISFRNNNFLGDDFVFKSKKKFKKKKYFVLDYDILEYKSFSMLIYSKEKKINRNWIDDNYNQYTALANQFNFINRLDEEDIFEEDEGKYFENYINTKLHYGDLSVFNNKKEFKKIIPEKHREKFLDAPISISIINSRKRITEERFRTYGGNVVYDKFKKVYFILNKGKKQGIFVGMIFNFQNTPNIDCESLIIEKVKNNKSYAKLYNFDCNFKNNPLSTKRNIQNEEW